MRADRLVSIILILQRRGMRSASQLARELGVSVRTIFRDIDALSSIGIPIYAESGSRGGYALLDDYRTDLTGLTIEELAAVFLLDRSPAVGSLGLGRHLSSALMKISAELPERTLERVEWFRRRILIEAPGESAGAGDHGPLPLLQKAVIQSKRIEFEIRWPRPGQSGRYAADPLGLVAAAEDWYLVAGIEGFARAYPLSMIRDVVITRHPSVRPPDFDLAAFWVGLEKRARASRPSFRTVLAIDRVLVQELSGQVTESEAEILDAASPDSAGGILVSVTFPDLPAARSFALAHGSAVEVVEPIALALSVEEFARQTVSRYSRPRVSRRSLTATRNGRRLLPDGRG